VAVQVKVTVTAELFQWLAFGCGETEAVIVGGVVAMLTWAVVGTEFPATSATIPVIA
jgi:hypothetical protein